MEVSRRRAAVGTFIGSAGNLCVVAVQAIVLIPLYLHYIGPRLYGAWLGSGDLLVWLQAMDLGIPNVLIQKIGAAHGCGDRRAAAEWFVGGICVLALFACGVVIVGGAVSPFVAGWMNLTGAEAIELQRCFFAGSVAAAIIVFNNAFVALSRGVQDTGFMNAVVVFSGIAGVALSVALIVSGFGLWSIVVGMATRALLSLVGSIAFVQKRFRMGISARDLVQRSRIKELVRVTPSTAVGGLSYAFMNHGEAAVAAIMIGPESAAILGLTRKAADLGRNILDAIAVASYGGFAHLVASEDRQRSVQVYAEINSFRVSAAVVIAAAYMAVNASFVSVWVGWGQYGGTVLTSLLGIHLVAVTGSYLVNYLYRASGRIVAGSLALLAEAVIRMPLMLLLARKMGLVGVPVAGTVTAVLFTVLIYRQTRVSLGIKERSSSPRVGWPVWLTRGLVFSTGLVLAHFGARSSWLYVAVTGTSVLFIGMGVLGAADPSVRAILSSCLSTVCSWLNSLRASRGVASGR